MKKESKDEKVIYYSQGRPYGAPLVRLRGKATYEIRDWLKQKGFRWSPADYAWEMYLLRDEFLEILKELSEKGFVIKPKKNLDDVYVYKEFPKKGL